MRQFNRLLIVFACLAGAISVLVAAYSAHIPGLEESSVRSVNSAIQMLQFHALALLVLGCMFKNAEANWFSIGSGLFFVIGILLFSVNIILHQLAGVSSFRSLIPFGGMAFVLGWIALAIAGLLPRQ